MLKIKTFTAPDRFGGTGLFAAEDIPAGTVVWEYNPEFTRFVSVDEYFQLSPQAKKIMENYSYPIYAPDEAEPMVGLLYNTDNTRYTNHAENPNTGHPEDESETNVALREIKKGEEITCDYREFDPEDMIRDKGVVTCKEFIIELGLQKKKNLSR